MESWIYSLYVSKWQQRGTVLPFMLSICEFFTNFALCLSRHLYVVRFAVKARKAAPSGHFTISSALHPSTIGSHRLALASCTPVGCPTHCHWQGNFKNDTVKFMPCSQSESFHWVLVSVTATQHSTQASQSANTLCHAAWIKSSCMTSTLLVLVCQISSSVLHFVCGQNTEN